MHADLCEGEGAKRDFCYSSQRWSDDWCIFGVLLTTFTNETYRINFFITYAFSWWCVFLIAWSKADSERWDLFSYIFFQQTLKKKLTVVMFFFFVFFPCFDFFFWRYISKDFWSVSVNYFFFFLYAMNELHSLIIRFNAFDNTYNIERG